MKWFKFFLIASFALSSRAGAQRFTFRNSARDCDLRQTRYDNPWWGVGWKMKRYEWHAFYIGVSLSTSWGGEKMLPISGLTSAVYTSSAEGLGPHLIGHFISNEYPIDWRDWVFDGTLRSAPFVFMEVKHSKSWKKKALWLALYGAAYLTFDCYADP